MDTRSRLPQSAKEKIIENANKKISKIDAVIKKKSNAGRQRTRTTTEPEAAGAAGGRSSRLSMLSTTSTLGSFTPKKK